MKILLASESYWPNLDGGAIAQRQLVQALTADGYDVVVWAPGKSLRSYRETDGKTLIYRERSIPMPGNRRYRFSLWPFWHCFTIVRRERPDIIHVETPFQIGLAALLAARAYRIPVIATNHIMPENLLSPELPRPIFYVLARLIWWYITIFHNHVDFVTTPSAVARSYLTAHKLRTPSQVITNGIDVDYFRPTETLNNNRPPVILYLGRHDREKNLSLLIRAAAILAQKADFRLEMVGEGSDLDRLRRLTQSLGISSRVVFHGRVSDIVKRQHYRQADIFAMPSPAELQSLVTVEAMASGLPVVAINAGALPNLVRNGENGYLVPPHDADRFAGRMADLLVDIEKRRQFGRAGRALICREHATSVAIRAYEEVYNQLVSRSLGRLSSFSAKSD